MQNKKWNLGNVPYELIVSNTTVICSEAVQETLESNIPRIELKDLCYASGYISN